MRGIDPAFSAYAAARAAETAAGDAFHADLNRGAVNYHPLSEAYNRAIAARVRAEDALLGGAA